MRISSVFDNLPKSRLIIECNNIYLQYITKWGELSSESGASCLRARFSWSELSQIYSILFYSILISLS